MERKLPGAEAPVRGKAEAAEPVLERTGVAEDAGENVLENTAPYHFRRVLGWICLVAGVILLIAFGVRLLQDRKYNLVSVMIAFLACVPFYFAYEKREGSIRRMVMIAVMTAIAVLGRLLFGPIPAFKPVSAIVILAGIYMGPESGFLVGSLSDADLGNYRASVRAAGHADRFAEKASPGHMGAAGGNPVFGHHGYMDGAEPDRRL